MRLPLMLIGMALLVACESDAKTLERLQEDAATAHLRITYYQHKADSLRDPATIAAYRDSTRQAEIVATLADRELNRFMAGR